METYYDTLNVKPDCSFEELRSSYLLLCKKYHPDKNGDEKMFLKIQKAYDILSDEGLRSDYDYELECGEGCAPNKVDINHNIVLTIDEIYCGCKKKFRLNGEIYDIDIPEKTLPGTSILLKGKGWNGGNLNLVVDVKKNPDMWMDEAYNIHIKKNIEWYDGILGTSFSIDILGENLEINVKKYSKTGDRIMVIGKGYPIGNRRLPVIIELNVNPPHNLNNEELELIERIKDIEGDSH